MVTNLAPHSCGCAKICEKILNNAGFDGTCKGNEETFSVSRCSPSSWGQQNTLELFAVKRNIFSEISKVLLNDTFAEFDGRSQIKVGLLPSKNLFLFASMIALQ